MPAALLAALVLQATPEILADLERAYDQTCLSRIYGQFDGMCSDMAEQVKRYRAELHRRPPPAKTASPPDAATASPAPPAEPPPSHEPPPPALPKG